MDYRNFSRLSRNIAAMLCLALAARADSATYTSQANDADAQYHLVIPHLSDSDKSSLQQTVADLKAKATVLDGLQSDIDTKKQAVSDAQTAYDNANTTATGLRQQANAANQDAAARIHQLVQQPPIICGQMGGAISGSDCTFTCPENQQSICDQKVASFDNQIAALKSQAASIAQSIQEGEREAEVAEADVNAKQQALEAAQTDRDNFNQGFNSKLEAFQQELQSFSNAIRTAQQNPIKLHLGPAYQQAQQVLNHMTGNEFTCYDTTCHDFGANSDGTLVVAPAPDVPASVPAEKVAQLQTEMQDLTKQYNEVHDKLRAAEANRDSSSGDLIRQLSTIQGKLEMQSFRMKSYNVNMNVAPP